MQRASCCLVVSCCFCLQPVDAGTRSSPLFREQEGTICGRANTQALPWSLTKRGCAFTTRHPRAKMTYRVNLESLKGPWIRDATASSSRRSKHCRSAPPFEERLKVEYPRSLSEPTWAFLRGRSLRTS